MLSEIIESYWHCALSAEIAEESAPVRLMIKLRIRSGRDADDVGGTDRDAVLQQRRGRAGRIDPGHRSRHRGVVEQRVPGGIGRGHLDRVLTAVLELGA